MENLEVENIGVNECERSYYDYYGSLGEEFRRVEKEGNDCVDHLYSKKSLIDKEYQVSCMALKLSSMVCIFVEISYLCSRRVVTEEIISLFSIRIILAVVTLLAYMWTARSEMQSKRSHKCCIENIKRMGSKFGKVLISANRLYCNRYLEDGTELLCQAKELSNSSIWFPGSITRAAQAVFMCTLFIRLVNAVLALITAVNVFQYTVLCDAKAILDFGALASDLMTLSAVYNGQGCSASLQVYELTGKLKHLLHLMVFFSKCLPRSEKDSKKQKEYEIQEQFYLIEKKCEKMFSEIEMKIAEMEMKIADLP